MVNHTFCSIAIAALIIVLVAISYRNISNEKDKSDAANYFTDITEPTTTTVVVPTTTIRDPAVSRPLPTLTSRKGTASMTLRESIIESGERANRKIETPATVIEQKNYTGQTYVVAPKIEINRNLGNQARDNTNDLDDFYHV